jgi:hypothetical protein
VIQNWSHVLSAPRHAWNRHRTMARAAWTRGRARAAGSELRQLLAQRALGEPRAVIGIDTDEAEYLASWPPGMPSAADQPTAGRVTSPRSYRAFINIHLIGGFTAAS